MPLDLPDGVECFVDSNILYYSLVSTLDLSTSCVEFVERIARGTVSASCSANVLADVLHKVMIAEVAKQSGRTRAGLVAWLKRHAGTIAGLTNYSTAANRIAAMPLRLLAVDASVLVDAANVATKYHLLTGDALIVALVQRHHILHLVTNDDDFDRVPGITVWKPRP